MSRTPFLYSQQTNIHSLNGKEGWRDMYTHLEDFILNLYRSIGISTPTQINMFTIARRLNVELTYDEKPIFCFGNEIILKPTNEVQEWLDFGHELAHVLLHSGNQIGMYPLYREYQEWRADLFALHFCIPTFMLEKIKLPYRRSEAIELIVNEFNVSTRFAETRLNMWINKQESLNITSNERRLKHGIL